MRQVIFGRRATSESGFAQVRVPGRRRRAIVRWSRGTLPSVCLPGATDAERAEAERAEAIDLVVTALIMRRWVAWWLGRRLRPAYRSA